MKLHSLKVDPQKFWAYCTGFAFTTDRLNDRDFKPGDFLIFHQTVFSASEMQASFPLAYTGLRVSAYLYDIEGGCGPGTIGKEITLQCMPCPCDFSPGVKKYRVIAALMAGRRISCAKLRPEDLL